MHRRADREGGRPGRARESARRSSNSTAARPRHVVTGLRRDLEFDVTPALAQLVAEDSVVNDVSELGVTEPFFGDTLEPPSLTVLEPTDTLALEPFSGAALVDTTWALPIEAPNGEVSSRVVSFSADGSAALEAVEDLTGYEAQIMTWSVDVDGKLALSTQANDVLLQELELVSESRATRSVLDRRPIDATPFPSFGDAFVLATSGAQPVSTTNVDAGDIQFADTGLYWQSTSNRWPARQPDRLSPTEHFGFRFDPDGVLVRFDGDIGQFATERWEIDGAVVRLQEVAQLDQDTVSSTGCDLADPRCVLLRERTWRIVSADAPYLWVLETYRGIPGSLDPAAPFYEATFDELDGRYEDASGDPVDLSMTEVLFPPRLNGYVPAPFPP